MSPFIPFFIYFYTFLAKKLVLLPYCYPFWLQLVGRHFFLATRLFLLFLQFHRAIQNYRALLKIYHQNTRTSSSHLSNFLKLSPTPCLRNVLGIHIDIHQFCFRCGICITRSIISFSIQFNQIYQSLRNYSTP